MSAARLAIAAAVSLIASRMASQALAAGGNDAEIAQLKHEMIVEIEIVVVVNPDRMIERMRVSWGCRHRDSQSRRHWQ